MNTRNYLNWKGYCNRDRHTAIYEAEHIINNFGYILDFQMFSDVEISMKIEIEENRTLVLRKALMDLMSIKGEDIIEMQIPKEIIILLNITFTKGTGDLRIEVPAIPG